jgi:polyisoprenoid-binding protein YceI
MSTRTKVLGAAGIAVVAIVVGVAGFIWYEFFRDDAPPEVSLAGALDSLASASATPGASATVPSDASPTGTSTASGQTGQHEGLDGTWTVDQSLGSFVGYRVGEELVGIGAATAVGRTPAVTGTIVIADNTVTSARVEADMTQLKSDDSRRDGQLRRQAIETDTYPTSTFELTQPIALPDGLADGTAFAVTLVGNLTLHGVTREVSIPAEAQLAGENLVVVGSLEIVFADYEIEKPRGAAVVSIEDTGIMELQLFLSRS